MNTSEIVLKNLLSSRLNNKLVVKKHGVVLSLSSNTSSSSSELLLYKFLKGNVGETFADIDKYSIRRSTVFPKQPVLLFSNDRINNFKIRSRRTTFWADVLLPAVLLRLSRSKKRYGMKVLYNYFVVYEQNMPLRLLKFGMLISLFKHSVIYRVRTKTTNLRNELVKTRTLSNISSRKNK